MCSFSFQSLALSVGKLSYLYFFPIWSILLSKKHPILKIGISRGIAGYIRQDANLKIPNSPGNS